MEQANRFAADGTEKENMPEIIRALHAKDDKSHALQQSLETERRQRRLLQAEAAAERAALQERFHQVEAELKRRLETQQATFGQQQEDSQEKYALLAEQLQEARCREARLLEKNEALTKDLKYLIAHAETEGSEMLALRARADLLAKDLGEAQEALRCSNKVRSGLILDAEAQGRVLEQVRAELREVQLLERSGRESSQAHQEHLSVRCESLARQAQERGREADVTLERYRRLEEALKVKELEFQTLFRDKEEHVAEVEKKRAQHQDEVALMRDELKARETVEAKLREAITAGETHLEESKMEDRRLRQEIFQKQASLDELGLQLQAGKHREQHMADAIKTLEERVRTIGVESESRQSAVLNALGRIQTLELELQGAHDAGEASRQELARVRAVEEEVRRDLQKRHEDKVSQRSGDLASLQEQLAGQRQELCEHRAERDRALVEVAQLKAEMTATAARHQVEIKGREDANSQVHGELGAAGDRLRAQEVEIDQVRREIDDAKARVDVAVADAKDAHAATAAVRAEFLEAEARWRRPLVAEEASQTSPRLMSEGSLQAPDKLWGREMAALHRSVKSLQSVMGVSPSAREEAILASLQAAGQDAALEDGQGEQVAQRSRGIDCVRTAVRTHVERRVELLQRRSLLQHSWHLWVLSSQTANVRAQLEMAVADELRLAAECRAREEGLSDVLSSRPPELTAATLKRLLLEFRHRTAAALSELSPTAPEEAHMMLTSILSQGRHSFGRLFHAGLFLYQKLRALVPSELRETLQEPWSSSMPIPFYVLPYKAPLVLSHGIGAVARRGGADSASVSPSRTAAKLRRRRRPQGSRVALPPAPPPEHSERIMWLESHITELEELLPLAANSQVEVPSFLVRLLWVRAFAGSPGPEMGPEDRPLAMTEDRQDYDEASHLRDRLDILLTDALTVFMSAWRAGAPPPELSSRAAQRAQRGASTSGNAAQKGRRLSSSMPATAVKASAARRLPGSPVRELRLGDRPRI